MGAICEGCSTHLCPTLRVPLPFVHLTLTYTENKVAKSIGLMRRVKPFLGKHSLLKLLYSELLKLRKLSRASTNRTDLKKLLR